MHHPERLKIHQHYDFCQGYQSAGGFSREVFNTYGIKDHCQTAVTRILD